MGIPASANLAGPPRGTDRNRTVPSSAWSGQAVAFGQVALDLLGRAVLGGGRSHCAPGLASAYAGLDALEDLSSVDHHFRVGLESQTGLAPWGPAGPDDVDGDRAPLGGADHHLLTLLARQHQPRHDYLLQGPRRPAGRRRSGPTATGPGAQTRGGRVPGRPSAGSCRRGG